MLHTRNIGELATAGSPPEIMRGGRKLCKLPAVRRALPLAAAIAIGARVAGMEIVN
jgi:hypothetical protein